MLFLRAHHGPHHGGLAGFVHHLGLAFRLVARAARHRSLVTHGHSLSSGVVSLGLCCSPAGAVPGAAAIELAISLRARMRGFSWPERQTSPSGSGGRLSMGTRTT